jgi:hypothetical protein
MTRRLIAAAFGFAASMFAIEYLPLPYVWVAGVLAASRGYFLHPLDPHPNPHAYALVARYVVDSILARNTAPTH